MTDTENSPVPPPKESTRVLGKGHRLIEGFEKITGHSRYAGDVTLPGMLHLRPVLSPHAHAIIEAIDKEDALAAPGVVAVLTADDLPSRDATIASRNSAVLAKEKVLFIGQPVVVVAAESEAAAQDGADRVRVSYRPLPAVVTIEQAIADGAPVVWPEGLPQPGEVGVEHAAVETGAMEEDRPTSNVHAHERQERGDVERGFAEADVIVERRYTTAAVHQGYLEPHAAVAEPGALGRNVTIYTSTQGQFGVRNEVADLVGLSRSRVRVVPMTVGGGFGAKYGIVEPLVAAAALALGRPARLVMTRSEDFLSTTPAPATVVELKTGARRDGSLTALEARIWVDNGAFAFEFGGIMALLLGSYYRLPNLRIDRYEVITNKGQGGAYRAPGAPQATFAIEANMDEMARELGLDPLEFRLANAIAPGDPMSNGKPWASTGLKEVLEALREHPAWQTRERGEHEGIGLAVGGWPCAVGPAAAVCRVDREGVVHIHVGSVDISGSNSSLVLVAAEVLGVEADKVELIAGDTDSGPFAPGSGGSQVTYSVSGAVAKAAEVVKTKLLALAAAELEARLDDLELEDGAVRVRGVPSSAIPIGRLATLAERRGGPGPLVGEGSSAGEKSGPGFVAHLVKVHVDPETGRVTPRQYVAVQDVGFALNPTMVEGQMHGGALQGIGWGLHEALRFDDGSGQLLTGTFLDYDLPKASAAPPFENVMVENPTPDGPYGARGVGEPPVTAGAAALANAIRDATGVRLTDLPMLPQALLLALNERA